jgi:hypothetical protein
MAHDMRHIQLYQRVGRFENYPHNLKVVGSNPTPATTFTELRQGSLPKLSAPAESRTMLAISALQLRPNRRHRAASVDHLVGDSHVSPAALRSARVSRNGANEPNAAVGWIADITQTSADDRL